MLSQSQGQVTHVLLTRSPLVYPRRGLTVRLACVKHAASVRPEPGSNSPLKIYRSDPRACLPSTVFETDRIQLLDLSIYFKGIVTRFASRDEFAFCRASPTSACRISRRQASLVLYLALTLSTLLSSQVSGASRASTGDFTLDFRLGQLGQLYFASVSPVKSTGLPCSFSRVVLSLGDSSNFTCWRSACQIALTGSETHIKRPKS